jgi:hypothetical protein
MVLNIPISTPVDLTTVEGEYTTHAVAGTEYII